MALLNLTATAACVGAERQVEAWSETACIGIEAMGRLAALAGVAAEAAGREPGEAADLWLDGLRRALAIWSQAGLSLIDAAENHAGRSCDSVLELAERRGED